MSTALNHTRLNETRYKVFNAVPLSTDSYAYHILAPQNKGLIQLL